MAEVNIEELRSLHYHFFSDLQQIPPLNCTHKLSPSLKRLPLYALCVTVVACLTNIATQREFDIPN